MIAERQTAKPARDEKPRETFPGAVPGGSRRYFIRYDRYGLISGCSDGLWNRPNKKWLQNRF